MGERLATLVGSLIAIVIATLGVSRLATGAMQAVAVVVAMTVATIVHLLGVYLFKD
jgi:uncharacterized protein YacL